MSEQTGPDGPEAMGFQLLKTSVGGAGARLGRLSLPNRVPVQTPSYVAVTSRGTVPHLTTDNLERHTSIESAYMALEDFVEKKAPPIFTHTSTPRPLHTFTTLPLSRLTILAARRLPAITTPHGNGKKHITLCTSTGFRKFPSDEYPPRAAALRPDILVPLADLPHTSAAPAAKKLARMVDRTEEWLDDLLRQRRGDAEAAKDVAVFAPVLPIERGIQWQYLERLSEEAGALSGLALYDVDLAPELAEYPSLSTLPRLVLQTPQTPQELLRQISLGADMTLVPFINDATDAGIALTFTFPAPSPSSTPLPLGSNLWDDENKTSLAPFMEGCACYACTSHHRAFLHHLFNANEMLSWTLVQVHNHHVMSRFFEGVRATLAEGQEAFEREGERFARVYEGEIPTGTGQRPRVRGYHFKSMGGDAKSNERPWGRLDEAEITGTKATSGLGAGVTG